MDRETLSSRLKDKKGTVTVTVAVLLVFLIMFAAFAIDVGYMMVRRNELQNIADTAALAAMGELGSVYSTMTFPDALAYAPARAPLLAKAQEVASATGVSGVTIASADFRLGVWNASTHTFIPQVIGPTAVNVTARKDGAANGPFSTLLAGVLGIGTFNVSATATASLTALYEAPPGTLPIPVGISYAWYLNPGYCDQPIKMYPTNDPAGCAAWHVYEEDQHSANQLQTILGGLTNQTYQSPDTISQITSYNFTGGTDASAIFNTKNGKGNIIDLFNAMKVLNDGVLDKDNNPNTWTTSVAVYNSTDCGNPSGDVVIVGFSTICIDSISSTPEKVIWAHVVCDNISSGPGGGGLTLGTMGSIPNLVQ